MRKYLWLFILFANIGILGAAAPTTTESNKTVEQLHSIFSDYSRYQKQRYPSVEHPDKDMRKGGFRDLSEAGFQQHQAKLDGFLQRLTEIDYSELSEDEKINADMFRFNVTSEINDIIYDKHLFPMEGDTGFYFDLLRLGDITLIKNEQDALFYIEKLESIPDFLHQWQLNLKRAVAINKVMPAIVLVDFEKPLEKLITDKASENPLAKPLQQLSKVLPEKQAEHLTKRALQAINNNVQPAVKSFIQFLVQDYLPHGRDSIAIEQIKDGRQFYQSQIKYYTTLNLSANEIHNIGLSEVRRIRAEMDKVIEASGFEGNFEQFIHYLRTDPQFYASSAEELLKEAAYISKKMDGKLPKFFSKLPRQPYGVEPVPDAIAPRYTTGRYVGAPLDSHRSGTYWVNTYALNKRPLYVLEALTLHEAVPGHHLQNALTKELSNLPKFRRDSYLSAYGEGWALYCEKLGIEAGFYQDPYSQFGRLTYEMWRAIRLVVDTGMHSKGWSREKAIKFMEQNTALSKHNVRTEIDRYIAWPGQALSYKMGEIKIVELRKKAEKALGQSFDIRAFHDEILANGPVTLGILERQINRWIERQLTK
ncbi:DUF885 domain-containing protein [Pleionea mediterranea]|uniref:Uncharacterized protein (DUF885 family) n=1 Tax=Pleionea mediterranea TaxID=523701 RepID=A0A316FMS0_9GAMM|nr:DUF885 domain-containing protein [Pleionea mediterranea]PWK50024.1 uncharacterized protein (DUF885 family) [Pleionea mediterranea]